MELDTKPEEEIEELCEGVETVALLACKTCFKDFESDRSEAAETLQEGIEKSGREVSERREVDFLCIERSTRELMEELDLDGVDALGTYSCGLGTQVVAGLTDALVLPLANSEGYRFFGGFYPTDTRLCAACGDCVLNETGGICPVAYCSKGLVNGPCGGAQDGKCEVDEQKDCVWLQIYDRLKEQGRVDSMQEGVRQHQYNQPGFAGDAELSEKVREMRDEGYPGGVHPRGEKGRTEDMPIEPAPVPDVFVLSLIQHIGQQCMPTVSPGDEVERGQMIGRPQAFVSAPVHSSVSGRVIAVEDRPHPVISTGVTSVVVENDHQDRTVDFESLQVAPETLTAERIVQRVRDAGVTGMGGAMFPTHVKLQPEDPVDVLILNGCECEPYLTGDHRLMVEQPERIVQGLELMARALGVERCIVAIEENKPEAIERMREAVGGELELEVMPTKYPQGAERMLVHALTGREVPADGIPIDVGAVVSNVGTAAAVRDAVVEGRPLMERVVTVTGPCADRAGNYRVRLGTPFADVLYGGVSTEDGRGVVIKMGGPMMGVEQSTLEVPIIKGSTGLTVLPEPDIEKDQERTCVRCGRCVEVCPMNLQPNRIWYHVKEGNWARVPELDPEACIECGACDYICASKLPLVSMIQTAKDEMQKAEA
ncbi:MAG: electron transport complex subunit RsxC [Planctomycetota bacterium]